MLAQREFLALQQFQLRIVSMSGGKATELGQAVFALDAAAHGRATDFDVTVERMTTPAGFNLRGTVSIVYTKTLGEDHPTPTTSARPARGATLRRGAGSRGARGGLHGSAPAASGSGGLSGHISEARV